MPNLARHDWSEDLAPWHNRLSWNLLCVSRGGVLFVYPLGDTIFSANIFSTEKVDTVIRRDKNITFMLNIT